MRKETKCLPLDSTFGADIGNIIGLAPVLIKKIGILFCTG